MKLGYFAMPFHEDGRLLADCLDEDLERIEFLERLGYGETWVAEHHMQCWEPVPSPELLIAAALQRTESMKFGTAVSCLPYHHPVQLAQRIAMLDHLARGRLYWGIGTSGYENAELFCVDWREGEHRVVFQEVLDAVLDLWDDPEPGLRFGSRFRFKIPEPNPPMIGYHMRTYQKPHPPIAVAAMTPKSELLTMAGEKGWLPMSMVLLGPILADAWRTYEGGALAAGRVPDRSDWRICRDVFIGESPAAAREAAIAGPIGRVWREVMIPTLKRYKVPLQALTGPGKNYGWDDVDALIEFVADNLWIVGDVTEVADKLNALQSDTGGFGTLLVSGQEWEDEIWKQSMTLLVDDVLPRVRGLDAAMPASGV